MNWQEELAARAASIDGALDRYLPRPDAKAACIDSALDRYLPRPEAGARPISRAHPPDGHPGTPRARPGIIHEAMRYSVFAGGKRLRGAFVLAAGEALGHSREPLLPAAAALEMIHTYSLIHDDLPAMDNDDLRRGKPTCHRVYGEAIAILAGDALLTLAFETLSRLESAGFEPGRVLAVISEVAAAAGSGGLIGGQTVDLESEGKKITPEQLEYIHLHKTAALFQAAVRCGAILAGAGARDLQALTDFGRCFGLAFQITDDILDLTGDEALLGKPLKSDLVKRKATYPGLFGLEQARQLAGAQVQQALQSIACLGARGAFLAGAATFLLNRKS
jgi:geranylgeranyl diphosphate synthase type II